MNAISDVAQTQKEKSTIRGIITFNAAGHSRRVFFFFGDFKPLKASSLHHYHYITLIEVVDNEQDTRDATFTFQVILLRPVDSLQLVFDLFDSFSCFLKKKIPSKIDILNGVDTVVVPQSQLTNGYHNIEIVFAFGENRWLI